MLSVFNGDIKILYYINYITSYSKQKNMSAIKLLNQFSGASHFYDDEDCCSVNEDSSIEFTHSIFVKSSVDTSDSITDDCHEDSFQDVEESIMNWFANKGVASGNPEDVI